jgi:hypothetical protein
MHSTWSVSLVATNLVNKEYLVNSRDLTDLWGMALELAVRAPESCVFICDECVAVCAQINADTVGNAKEAHEI